MVELQGRHVLKLLNEVANEVVHKTADEVKLALLWLFIAERSACALCEHASK